VDKLTPEILSRLDALAAKLGVTVQFIWSVLLQQAKVVAITDLTAAVFTGTVACICCYKLYTLIKEEAEKDARLLSGWQGAAGARAMIFSLGLIAGLIAFFTALPAAITPLFNPQYWALSQILNVIK